jgi:threonine/homoserine/homoserine lactone efflux protein
MIILEGFKFGLLLQLAVGTLSLMTFKISSSLGITYGFIFVGSVTLIDSLYIFLASIGISAVLKKDRIQKYFKYVGGVILMIFGTNILLSCFNYAIIPSINVNINNFHSIFLQGIIITLSDPLTIIFWGGVFSGKISNEKYTKTQLFMFGIGCILSTIISLSIIAIIGNFVKIFLTEIIIKILNIIIGIVIIIFGIKMIIRKNIKASPNVA